MRKKSPVEQFFFFFFVPESSKSEVSTASSQCFRELYLSLKEEPSLLILIVTEAPTFILVKQQKSPTPTLMIIHYLSTLKDTFSTLTVMTEIIDKGPHICS